MSEIKRCYKCKEFKSVDEFYRSNKVYYQKECKVCNRERKYRWHHTEEGKRSSMNTKLKRRFGISVEEYDEMLKNQKGMCLICGKYQCSQGHNLAVDHDHRTGKIRGLLCKSCNVGIGNFYDRPDLLLKAANYLIGVTK